jgi:hypothetical protein
MLHESKMQNGFNKDFHELRGLKISRCDRWGETRTSGRWQMWSLRKSEKLEDPDRNGDGPHE